MEAEFVGRKHYLTELRKAFQRYSVISVCGLKTVGKSRLVSEYLKVLTSGDGSKKVRIMSVDMHHHGNTESLYLKLCSDMKVVPIPDAAKTDDWIHHLVLHIQQNTDTDKDQWYHHVIVFDNAEDAVEQKVYPSFVNLVHMLTKHCNNIKIILTSTTDIFLSALGKVHCPIKLKPMLPFEARQLLEQVTQGVKIGSKEMDALVELSDGLPLLLLMIGSELKDKDRGITPEQMVEMLAEFRLEATSRECYPPERRAGDVYTTFIQRLSEIHQSRLEILNYIPGTFNVREAKEMLAEATDAETKLGTIQPMLRRHMMYNRQRRRFNIHGILRECMDTFPKIKNLPEIQTRYYRLFSAVMTEVCHRFGTAEYTKALAEFSVEQPNFTKLLNEVSNSTHENYKFFIHVAKTCTSLLEQYMTGQSDIFYKGCLMLADRHGEDADKAVVYVAIGSLSTNGKGSFVSGEENYRLALALLERNGRSRELTSLYQRMGWNLHNQGRNFESLRYLERALEISSVGGGGYRGIMIQTLNNLGTVHNWIGNYESARKCTQRVMEERKATHGENHPFYAICLNQMGLIYDQMGKPVEAMKYFAEALQVKRKVKATIHSLTISLNNMANKYREAKRFDEAKVLLDEAMSSMNGLVQKNMGGLSLTHNSYGKLYKDMQDYEKAEESYRKSEEIRRAIMPKSIPYVWTAIQLAQVKVIRRKYKSALKIVDAILEDKKIILKTMPHNDFVYEALKIKADIYLENGHLEKYKDILNEMQLDLARLLNVYMEKENYRKYDLFKQEWLKVKAKVDSG